MAQAHLDTGSSSPAPIGPPLRLGKSEAMLLLLARWSRLLGGLASFALGLSLMIRAGLGLSSWDVLHDALRTLTPLTFGQVIIAVSVLVLVASIGLGVRPGAGTIANALLVGAFTDAILSTPLLAELGSGYLALRAVVMIAGIGVIAFGSAMYISADLGAGPRDSLMLGIARRTGRSAGRARTVIEVVVVVAGIALGGSAGFGTVAFVVLIGPAIDVSFRLFGLQPRRADRSGGTLRRISEQARRWARRGQLGPGPSTEAGRHSGARI